MNLKRYRGHVVRESIKLALRSLVRWQPLQQPLDGYSIILPVPWDLRHLLPTSLLFLDKLDLCGIVDIHVIFDRTRHVRAEHLMADVINRFPKLPLRFGYHDDVAGALLRRVHSAAFYHAMSCVMGLRACRTRFAVLHDFDLYPLVSDYFVRIIEKMRKESLHFCGHELSTFDGLNESDCIIGTWALGIDVERLRSLYSPGDCFHGLHRLNGRLLHLDPFSHIEALSPRRALSAMPLENAFCHGKNLCSTYLQFIKGQNPKIVWRLHYLWYLEYLAGAEAHLREATFAMNGARSSVLSVDNCKVDFSNTDPTCANVLSEDVRAMEGGLHGSCRPEVNAFLEAFARFLLRFGRCDLVAVDGGPGNPPHLTARMPLLDEAAKR
ncbi:MAG: hypothetical protein ACTHN5_20955 [Phycisphaerae bacterium]